MVELKNALSAHNLNPSDFDTTIEDMDSAAPGTQWKCQKGNVNYTVTKNSQTSYNIQTDQHN